MIFDLCTFREYNLVSKVKKNKKITIKEADASITTKNIAINFKFAIVVNKKNCYFLIMSILLSLFFELLVENLIINFDAFFNFLFDVFFNLK